MKYNYCLVVVIALCVYVSYTSVQKSNASLARAEDEALIDKFIESRQGESFAGTRSPSAPEANLSASGKSSQEKTKILPDGSKIDVMYDGFGNKTETRCFNNNSRLKCVTLTSAVNGQRQAVVYGQNGERNTVPENMIDNLLTASGDEIANSAGILAAPRQTPQAVYAQATPLPAPPRFSKPADNQSSIQNEPTEQVENINHPELTIDNSEIESLARDMKNQGIEKRTASARKPQ